MAKKYYYINIVSVPQMDEVGEYHNLNALILINRSGKTEIRDIEIDRTVIDEDYTATHNAYDLVVPVLQEVAEVAAAEDAVLAIYGGYLLGDVFARIRSFQKSAQPSARVIKSLEKVFGRDIKLLKDKDNGSYFDFTKCVVKFRSDVEYFAHAIPAGDYTARKLVAQNSKGYHWVIDYQYQTDPEDENSVTTGTVRVPNEGSYHFEETQGGFSTSVVPYVLRLADGSTIETNYDELLDYCEYADGNYRLPKLATGDVTTYLAISQQIMTAKFRARFNIESYGAAEVISDIYVGDDIVIA